MDRCSIRNDERDKENEDEHDFDEDDEKEKSEQDDSIKSSTDSSPMTYIKQENPTTTSFEQCLIEELRSMNRKLDSIDSTTQVKKYGPVPAGKHWKSMETRKQYSDRKVSGFFPWTSD